MAARQLGHELAGQQVRVRPRDEDGEAPVGVEGVHHLLVPIDVLDLIDEEVLEVVVHDERVDGFLELVRGPDAPIAALVEVYVDDVLLGNPSLHELLSHRLHEAGLAAAPDARHDLHDVIVIERTNLLEVGLSPIDPHGQHPPMAVYSIGGCYFRFKGITFSILLMFHR